MAKLFRQLEIQLIWHYSPHIFPGFHEKYCLPETQIILCTSFKKKSHLIILYTSFKNPISSVTVRKRAVICHYLSLINHYTGQHTYTVVHVGYHLSHVHKLISVMILESWLELLQVKFKKVDRVIFLHFFFSLK